MTGLDHASKRRAALRHREDALVRMMIRLRRRYGDIERWPREDMTRVMEILGDVERLRPGNPAGRQGE